MGPASRENRDFWLMLAVAALIGAALFAMMPVSRMLRAQNYFAHWYIGGSLFGTPDLHNQEANQVLQVKYVGGFLEYSYFIRPTFYGLLLKPHSWMP